MTNNPVYQTEFANPLGRKSHWSGHKRLAVGVHDVACFNGFRVRNVIEIMQVSEFSPTLRTVGDFKELNVQDVIQTDAAGARLLAAKLIEAADAAEGRVGEGEG